MNQASFFVVSTDSNFTNFIVILQITFKKGIRTFKKDVFGTFINSHRLELIERAVMQLEKKNYSVYFVEIPTCTFRWSELSISFNISQCELSWSRYLPCQDVNCHFFLFIPTHWQLARTSPKRTRWDDYQIALQFFIFTFYRQ